MLVRRGYARFWHAVLSTETANNRVDKHIASWYNIPVVKKKRVKNQLSSDSASAPVRSLWAVYRYDPVHGPVIEIKYPNCVPILVIQLVHSYEPNRSLLVYIMEQLRRRYTIKVNQFHMRRIADMASWLVPYLIPVSVPS